MNLKPYQQVGRDFLAERKMAALYDDMRLGKTRQFLMAAKQVGCETIAVVAKATGVYEWEMQSQEAGFNPVILKSKDSPIKGRFNIMSYNALISKLHPKLMNMHFDLVGGDETDQVKNHKAKRTTAFFGARMDRAGGITGQAEALRLGIARALVEIDPEYRPILKKNGLMKRDPRMVERKKPGQPKARKQFQFSKR